MNPLGKNYYNLCSLLTCRDSCPDPDPCSPTRKLSDSRMDPTRVHAVTVSSTIPPNIAIAPFIWRRCA